MFESFKRRVASAVVSDDILLKGLLIGKDGALRKRLGGGHGKTSKTEFFGHCLSSQAINPSQAGSNHLVNKTLWKHAVERNRRCNRRIGPSGSIVSLHNQI